MYFAAGDTGAPRRTPAVWHRRSLGTRYCLPRGGTGAVCGVPHLLVRPRARGVMLCGLRQLSPPAAVRDAGSAVGPDRPQRL